MCTEEKMRTNKWETFGQQCGIRCVILCCEKNKKIQWRCMNSGIVSLIRRYCNYWLEMFPCCFLFFFLWFVVFTWKIQTTKSMAVADFYVVCQTLNTSDAPFFFFTSLLLVLLLMLMLLLDQIYSVRCIYVWHFEIFLMYPISVTQRSPYTRNMRNIGCNAVMSWKHINRMQRYTIKHSHWLQSTSACIALRYCVRIPASGACKY